MKSRGYEKAARKKTRSRGRALPHHRLHNMGLTPAPTTYQRHQSDSQLPVAARPEAMPDMSRVSNKCNNALIQVKLSKVMIYYAKKATMNKN